MAGVVFRAVGKVYPDGNRALSGLDLAVADGELMVLVGPSGCGKSTALRMVAGLEEVTEGEIAIGERTVNRVPPQQRDVAMVFQNYALYPHLSVYDNIAYPLRSRGVPRGEIRARVERTAAAMGLGDLLRRKPRTLSGGQRQRVAMARAMVREPQAFLMDEPLSNLDAKLRVQMRAEIARLQHDLAVTMLYVTHDQVEAMTMGDRIAALRKGVLQQLGTARQLYDEPVNLFVATFIGSPAMNLLRARVSAGGPSLRLTVGEQTLDVEAGRWASVRRYDGAVVALGVRPEHCQPPRTVEPTWPRLRGRVRLVETLGAEELVHLDIEGEPVLADEVLEVVEDADASMVQSLHQGAEERRVPVVARFPTEEAPAPESLIEVALRPDRLHLFDLATGAAIH